MTALDLCVNNRTCRSRTQIDVYSVTDVELIKLTFRLVPLKDRENTSR